MENKTGTQTEKEKHFTSNICVECANAQRNCCSLEVPLTIEDINRIESKGFKLTEFSQATSYEPEELEDQEDWWIDNFPKKDGELFKVTTKVTDDKCFFLEKGKGCSLGKDRPTICKSFPFWVYDDKVEYEPGDSFCFFERKGVTIHQGLSMIGETEEAVKSYIKHIEDDCRKNKDLHEKLLKDLPRAD